MTRTIKYFSLTAGMMAFNGLFAQAGSSKPAMADNNLLFIAMGTLAAVLLLVILILSGVLRTAVKTRIREMMESKGVRVLVTLFLTGISAEAFAQADPAKGSLYEAMPVGGLHPLGFYSLFVVLLLELFVILWLCLMILRIIVRKEVTAAAKAGEEVQKVSFFTRYIGRKLFGVKPVESDKDVLLDHDYDGIKELDNDLPPWWKYGFYMTILTSVIYLTSYHVTHTSKSSEEEYNAEMAEAEASVKAYRAKMALDVDESNAVFLTDAAKLESGKAVYMKSCAVCHGNEGQGVVGPNFTDNHWLYGNKAGDLFKIVKNGTNKGMKAWKDELSPVEIQNVISYIYTLKGSKPANPKAPEGTEYSDEAPASGGTAPDSSKNIEIKS